MGAFRDVTITRLADPAALKELVFPVDDPEYARIRALFASVFDLPYAIIHDVAAVEVLSSECEIPLFPARVLIGSWTQTIPSQGRTDIQYEGTDGAAPSWVDISAELAVTLVLSVDPGDLELFRVGDIGEFATLEEFRAKFRYLDLDAFMAEHGLRSVDDLRRAFRYLRGEVKLRPVPSFDPADPANRRRFRLRVAVLVRETLDVTAALRDVRVVMATAERSVPYRRETPGDGEAKAPWAPLLIFSSAGVSPEVQNQLIRFFGSQNLVAIFENPPPAARSDGGT